MGCESATTGGPFTTTCSLMHQTQGGARLLLRDSPTRASHSMLKLERGGGVSTLTATKIKKLRRRVELAASGV